MTIKPFKKLKKRQYRQAKQNLAEIWANLIAANPQRWQQARDTSQTGKRILIATSTTGHKVVTPVETALAAALTLRGADVHFLVCDRFLPVCWQPISTMYPDLSEFVRHGISASTCRKCHLKGLSAIEALGLTAHPYSQLVTPPEYEEAAALSASIPIDAIPSYHKDGLAIGEQALAGALRFFATGNLDDEPFAEGVLRRYFKSSLVTVTAVGRLLDRIQFDCVVCYHGIYVPEGLIDAVARSKKVRVVNWLNAYRKRCFIFSHEDTYHHTLMDEPVASWDTMPWSAAAEYQLMDYLKSRWRGSRDWITFLRQPQFDLAAISREIGVDFTKPCVGMLTNVMWDAQLHYPANAFANMLEWVLQTIRYFTERPELQLIIRVHPAEITGLTPSRQPIVDEIRRVFQDLPPNVVIIPPESQVSTYVTMLQCDSVIIYGTKTGVELTSMGVPVIVAGEAWIRNKGITRDASSVEAYFRILDQLPLGRRMRASQIQRARRYAFHFFFRRMIPLDFIKPTGISWPPYILELKALRQLERGQSRGLDVACEGILQGQNFIYPAERHIEWHTYLNCALNKLATKMKGGSRAEP